MKLTNRLITLQKQIFGNKSWEDEFKKLLDEVQIIKKFDESRWTKEIRNILRRIAQHSTPKQREKIIKITQSHKENFPENTKEIYDYFDMLFSYNNETEPEERLGKIITYRKKYPFNPEFLSFESYCYRELHRPSKYMKSATDAYSLDMSYEEYEINAAFAIEMFLNQFIIEKKYEEGIKEIDKFIEKPEFLNTPKFRRVLQTYNYRLQDRLDAKQELTLLKQKTEKIRKDFEEKANKEQRRTIEILGIFTAVIAFIFSAVTVGSELNLYQGIVIIGFLAIVLVGFAILMHLFFSKEEEQKPLFWKTIFLILLATMILGIGYTIHYKSDKLNESKNRIEVSIKK